MNCKFMASLDVNINNIQVRVLGVIETRLATRELG